MSSAETYARWVLDPINQVRTGRLIKLAAQRFLNDLERDDIYFDEVEAAKMPNFSENYCYQWEGDWRGKPFDLMLWQRFHLDQLFGWIVKKTGTRRFTKLYLQIAKKNGKSSECALISTYHVFADERVNTPKVFTAANNEDQAKICVNMAGRIIEQSPELYEYVLDGDVKLSTYGSNITEVIHKTKDGFIKAMSKEGGDKKAKTSGGKHGINASLGLVDEFGMSPDQGASGAIYTSMASRKERLMAYLTTAGFNMDGPCYRELRDQGIKVLEGTIVMDNYLPIIYELDKPLDEEGKDREITIQWLLDNPDVWEQPNPNIDVSVNRDYLKEMLQNALNLGGTTEVDVKTLNFNMWVNSAETFISADIWNKNSYGGFIEDLDAEECYGGLEIAPSGQVSAFAFIFPGEIRRVKMIYFAANDSVKDHEFYNDNRKFINIDQGNEVENDWAIKLLEKEIQKYNMNSFCFPNTQKNNSIVQGLIKLGYTGNPISQGLQGISNPTAEWEKILRAFHVEHFDNPVLRWQSSNCLVVRKEAGIRLEKNGNVLGVYACLNALSQMLTIEAEDSNDKLIQSW